jgi:hypothetical protein
MTALAEARKPGRLRLQLDGLWLELGYPAGRCFRVHLEPDVALKLAHDLTVAAVRSGRAGAEALAELDAITRGEDHADP